VIAGNSQQGQNVGAIIVGVNISSVICALLLSISLSCAGLGDGIFSFDNSQAGTSVLPFLKLPIGARATAMGNYDGPALNDPFAMFWNPARLPTIQGFQTEFSHSEYLGEFRHEVASTVFGVPYLGNVGLGFSGLFATAFDGARNINEDPAKITALDFSLGVAYGYSLFDSRLFVGTKINWIHSQLDDVMGDGYSVDLGLAWRMPKHTWGSAVVQNLAHGFSYRSGTGVVETMPAMMQIGWGYADSVSPIAWQIGYSKTNDASQRLHAGGEWNYHQTFFVRSGYEYNLINPELGWDNGITMGLGLRLSTLGLDYSVRSMGDLGLVHSLTFSVHPPVNFHEQIDHLKLAREAWKRGDCNEAVKESQKTLREDPSKLDAVAIEQACEKEERVSKSEYVALAYTANTEGQALTFWDMERLNGGLSRRKTLLERVRMQYPGLAYLDAGSLFSKDTLEPNDQRIVDLYSQLFPSAVLLGSRDVGFVQQKNWGASLPWISTAPIWSLPLQSKPWSLLKVKKHEVAIFGFSENSAQHLSVEWVASEIQKARDSWGHAPALQVIMLDASEKLAAAIANTIQGIDLVILSGTNEMIPTPLHVHETWITCPGRRGEALGLAVAWYDDGPTARWEFHMMPIDEAVRPDSVFAEALGEEWRHDVGENTEVVKPLDYEDFLFTQVIEDGRRDVWIADHTIGHAARLTKNPANITMAEMAWSRKQFFFVVDSGNGHSGIFLQPIKEKVAQPIMDSAGQVLEAHFEPYENWLYYVKQSDALHSDLYRTTWKGTHVVNLSRGEAGLVRAFDVSPDGRNLVLESNVHGHLQLIQSGLNLSRLVPITSDSVDARSAHYDPHGLQIAYLVRPVHSTDDAWDLMLWDTRLGTARILSVHRDIHRLSWSQDGSKLFLEVGVNRSSILAFDIATAQEQTLRTSLDEVKEESHATAHRWKGVAGLLYESKGSEHTTILWAPQEKIDQPLQPVEFDPRGAWLP